MLSDYAAAVWVELGHTSRVEVDNLQKNAWYMNTQIFAMR